MQEKTEETEMTKKEIIAITHKEDLDGIGSACLLKKKFGDSLDLILSDYGHYEKDLEIILKISCKMIIIADLGFNEGLINLIPLFRNSKAEIIWFDHHHLAEKYKKILQDSITLVRAEDKTVSTELINNFYFGNDRILNKIAKLAHISDNKIHNETANKLGLVIDGSQNNEEDLLKIIELLLNGEFDNNWINKKFLDLQNSYMEEYEKIIERIEEYKLKNLRILLSWSDLVTASRISQYFIELHNPDVAIGVNSKTRQVNLKSKKHVIRQIARAFHGGGHDHRAGFIYPKNPIEENKISKDLLNTIFENITKFINIT
ncbi:MAG: hypothetical protein EAX96_01450 [Candidatus Lokiarchaeota archaeon]|nr:hypothetical protein [Candidatus Lokiarchaeota archaeon]